ncbi:hypothetical protein [Luteibacter sp. CQ10]|uniref:hypothetical protein n=1 Tax=Luteibacter sp. CQ10 TaxID=2805821 RepID=UPI0034A25332
MKKRHHPKRRYGALPVLCIGLIGCGTPPAKDFGGFWKPVNRFDTKINEVPLALPYTYYASPTDGTLKTLLTRWAEDTGATLSYRLRSDFTLPKAASRIHTSETRDAMAQLSAIYVKQGFNVLVDGPQIVVEEIKPAAIADAANGALIR